MKQAMIVASVYSRNAVKKRCRKPAFFSHKLGRILPEQVDRAALVEQAKEIIQGNCKQWGDAWLSLMPITLENDGGLIIETFTFPCSEEIKIPLYWV